MDFKAIIFLPIVFLVACSGADSIAKVGKVSVLKPAFEAHLAFKRIDPQSEERVTAELDAYLTQTALAQAIANQALTNEALLAAEFTEFKNQMTISRYMATYLEAAVTNAAVENYYNGHQDEFSRKQAHVAHIVFRVHNAMTDVEQQAAQQKAREIMAKLAKGEAFDVLAQQHSDDLSSGEKGGDLGWVAAQSIDPEFAEAVFDLAEGQTSDVVKTQYGYHIIKLLEPVRTNVPPLSQVEGDIRYQLRQKAKLTETQRLLDSITISKTE
jgi:hypothetical protein